MKRALTQSQASELLRAASVLPPASRDAFLRAVDGHLVGIRRQLTDDDVNAAIVTVLADASITTTSHFICDAAPAKEAAMARKFEIVDRHGNPVDDDIIPDGGRLRVPMMARDGLSDIQRAIMDAKAARFDDTAARHQPGPIYCDTAGLERKARAYADSVRDLTEAWRTPPSLPDAWKTNNMSDREVARLHITGDAKRDAYLDYVEDLTSAWQGRR